jgi:SAM-dependent methyltransferase
MKFKENITDAWGSYYQLPSPGNMMEQHDRREKTFVNQGTKMATAIIECIHKYRPIQSLADMKILDFGCGVGRVALPLFYHFQKPDHCVDVDPNVISYLKNTIPGARPKVTAFDPPLPFEADSFDVVYAVSVWTHLEFASGCRWLEEIRRILAPGGLALLTTSNYSVLDIRRKHPKLGPMGWSDISDEDLRREGFIFLRTPSPPGTGAYGMASHDPEWIKREWSRFMPVIGVESGAILGAQDINILMKPAKE